MDYTKDFKKWRQEKIDKLAFKMYTVHGLPLEYFNDEMLKLTTKEKLLWQLNDWIDYCKEKKVPEEELEKNRKKLQDNKEELILELDKLL